jgi:hypothetical protein
VLTGQEVNYELRDKLLAPKLDMFVEWDMGFGMTQSYFSVGGETQSFRK